MSFMMSTQEWRISSVSAEKRYCFALLIGTNYGVKKQKVGGGKVKLENL